MIYLAVFLVVLVIARAIFFKGPWNPVEGSPPEGIVDMHCHTAGIAGGENGARVSKELQGSWKFGLYLKIFGTSEYEVKEKGDGLVMDIIAKSVRESRHVSRAVILAMDAPHDHDGEIDEDKLEVYVPNRFVADGVKNHEELLYGASVHPNRSDALEELEWSKKEGAVLVKWLPNIQGVDPSDSRYRAYYEKLAELDLPLLTHVGDEDSFSKTENELGDPRLLELPLQCGVRVIAAHVASSGERDGIENIDHLLNLMPKYPNLFADLSTLTQMNRRKYLAKVLGDQRLEGRLMYGTDYPLTRTPLVTAWQYPLRLKFREMWTIWRCKNSWDRDVLLKWQLGCPKEVFHLSESFLEEKIRPE